MKFWLACFVLLFAGAELLQWVTQVGQGQISVAWLILGGMGLAAASNASHLPGLGGDGAGAELGERGKGEKGKGEKQANADELTERVATKRVAREQERVKLKTDRSEDSISFKVRLPWR